MTKRPHQHTTPTITNVTPIIATSIPHPLFPHAPPHVALTTSAGLAIHMADNKKCGPRPGELDRLRYQIDALKTHLRAIRQHKLPQPAITTPSSRPAAQSPILSRQASVLQQWIQFYTSKANLQTNIQLLQLYYQYATAHPVMSLCSTNVISQLNSIVDGTSSIDTTWLLLYLSTLAIGAGLAARIDYALQTARVARMLAGNADKANHNNITGLSLLAVLCMGYNMPVQAQVYLSMADALMKAIFVQSTSAHSHNTTTLHALREVSIASEQKVDMVTVQKFLTQQVLDMQTGAVSSPTQTAFTPGTSSVAKQFSLPWLNLNTPAMLNMSSAKKAATAAFKPTAPAKAVNSAVLPSEAPAAALPKPALAKQTSSAETLVSNISAQVSPPFSTIKPAVQPKQVTLPFSALSSSSSVPVPSSTPMPMHMMSSNMMMPPPQPMYSTADMFSYSGITAPPLAVSMTTLYPYAALPSPVQYGQYYKTDSSARDILMSKITALQPINNLSGASVTPHGPMHFNPMINMSLQHNPMAHHFGGVSQL